VCQQGQGYDPGSGVGQEAVVADMILMIDNYDSFTYNLVQYLGELGADISVYRNDAITVEQIEGLEPDGIVISPGPCTPDRAGISVEVVKRLAGRVPILGVCLGHQAVGSAFGAEIVRAPRIMHGKTSLIYHDRKGLFAELPSPFEATRYHSLVIDPARIPEELEVSARTDQGEIMGVRHRKLMVDGVQFHPESILTTAGKKLLGNFISLLGSSRR